ncbi:hypothetical protein PGT21_002365 [Puccinia graminis f. sp. tritici]|uniref:Uncharacterized protein n=1 Tax=Puccinia graminis f. sp. tritici TaxID=56615 RepID=A0A5B0QZG8_PUCGR|nr:hypothetical protein PGT21_002365 [Puccinia graminis f. sp. tritici]
MIKRRLPKLQLPTGLNKSSAIGFFHRYLMPPHRAAIPRRSRLSEPSSQAVP